MPLNPNIALQTQAPQVNPFASLGQVLQIRGMLEQNQALGEQRRAIAEQRQMQTAIMRQEQQRAEALRNLKAWTPDTVFPILGPEAGAKALKAIEDLRMGQFDNEEKVRKSFATRLAGIAALPEPLRAEAWDLAVTDYGRRGVLDPQQIGPYAPEKLAQFERELLSPDKRYEIDNPKPVEVGGSLVDVRPGQDPRTIYTAPQTPQQIEAAKRDEERLRLERQRVGLEGRRVGLAEAQAKREQEMMGVGPGLGITGDKALEGVPAGVQNVVKMLTEYKMPLPSGMALRTPYWQNVLQLAAAYDPTFDASQYEARRRTRTDFASGKAAANIRSLNTAVGHLDTLRHKIDALDNRDLVFWNKVANATLAQTGDPRVRDFEVAATAVEGELASLFKGTGATDQEIKQWRASLDSSQSPAQLKAAMDTATELLASRLEALRNQYQTGMGKAPDFQVLSEKSRKLLKSVGIDADALDPPSGATLAQQAAPVPPAVAQGLAGKPDGVYRASDGSMWVVEQGKVRKQ